MAISATKINVFRVMLGGAVSGLVLSIGEHVLNQVVLVRLFANANPDAKSATAPFSAVQVVSGVAILFAFGFALIWIYAAIRPRFGAGAKTAVIAGLTVWGIGWLLTGASFINVGIFPPSQMLVSIIWGLFEVPLAALAGAWLYRENTDA